MNQITFPWELACESVEHCATVWYTVVLHTIEGLSTCTSCYKEFETGAVAVTFTMERATDKDVNGRYDRKRCWHLECVQKNLPETYRRIIENINRRHGKRKALRQQAIREIILRSGSA